MRTYYEEIDESIGRLIPSESELLDKESRLKFRGELEKGLVELEQIEHRILTNRKHLSTDELSRLRDSSQLLYNLYNIFEYNTRLRGMWPKNHQYTFKTHICNSKLREMMRGDMEMTEVLDWEAGKRGFVKIEFEIKDQRRATEFEEGNYVIMTDRTIPEELIKEFEKWGYSLESYCEVKK